MRDFQIYQLNSPQSKLTNLDAPFAVIPSPSTSDIGLGQITRYFIRQVNQSMDGEITEVDSKQFSKLAHSSLYQGVQLVWRIAGSNVDILPLTTDTSITRLYTGVQTANTNITIFYDKQMPGLKDVLNNPLQFYQGG